MTEQNFCCFAFSFNHCQGLDEWRGRRVLSGKCQNGQVTVEVEQTIFLDKFLNRAYVGDAFDQKVDVIVIEDANNSYHQKKNKSEQSFLQTIPSGTHLSSS